MLLLHLVSLSLALFTSHGQRDTAAELNICEELGTEAGEFAFIGPCSVLKLVCPPPSRQIIGSDTSIGDVPKEPPLGLSEELLEDALESSCQLIFASFCKRASVMALFSSDDEDCKDILTNPPAFTVPDCPTFDAAVMIFREELERTCELTPEFVTNQSEILASRDRPAYQSTTISGQDATLAVDGNLRTSNCASTGFRNNENSLETSNPWWAVDLLAAWNVTRVVITNNDLRPLSNFEIRVGDVEPFGKEGENPSASNSLCVENANIKAGGVGTFDCIRTGRYVVVRIPGEEKILSLCEVQVFVGGDDQPKIETAPLLSKDKPTFQKSTLGNSVSGKAVDGNKDADFSAGSCTHTGFDSQGRIPLSPWWAVDLGSSQRVSVVRITNRSDCCDTRLKDFEIRIGDDRPEGSGDQNKVCASGSSIPRGETYQYDCNSVGRYVMIRIPDKQAILTLCEVEVFG